MHYGEVLGSSIPEKIIIDLLCGNRYFFAIAIRFPVKFLSPLRSLIQKPTRVALACRCNDKNRQNETLQQIKVTLKAFLGEWFDNRNRERREGQLLLEKIFLLPLIRTLRQYIQRHGGFSLRIQSKFITYHSHVHCCYSGMKVWCAYGPLIPLVRFWTSKTREKPAKPTYT